MNNSSVLESLKKGIKNAKAGNTVLARMHLQQAFAVEPENETLLLWMAWTADSPAGAAEYLKWLLEKNPDHEAAKRGIAWLNELINFDMESISIEDKPRSIENSAIKKRESKSHREITKTENLISIQKVQSEREDSHQQDETAELRDSRNVQAAIKESEEHESVEQGDHIETNDASIIKRDLNSEEESKQKSLSGNSGCSESIEVSSEPEVLEDQKLHWFDKSLENSPVLGEDASQEFRRVKEHDTDVYKPNVIGMSEISEAVETVTHNTVEESKRHITEHDLGRSVQSTPLNETQESRSNDITEKVAEVHPESILDDSLKTVAIEQYESTRPTILVVDDSATVRKLVAMSLDESRYRVVGAVDGVAAIDEIARYRPSLILMDISMPRLDGYQLCKLVKKNSDTSHIPVVMLSGKDGTFDKLRGRLAGCTDYITKPFQADVIVNTVEHYLPGND